MLPIVNGKQLFDCSEEDLNELINNADYRENLYLEYKAEFSFLKQQKGSPKQNECIAEFRSDVCSFANVEGGYLVYGIREQNGTGIPEEIVGVDVTDGKIDRFELNIRNKLVAIMPKMPSISFHFIQLENKKYVVILHVRRDYYVPYIHVVDEKDYRIYKRVGNTKQCIGYTELKSLFNQSISIESEVQRFREERMNYYRSIEDTKNHSFSQFLLFHIIPDTFTDSYHNKDLFYLERSAQLSLSNLLSQTEFSCSYEPCVDGLRFPSWRSEKECKINNNGVFETFVPMDEYISRHLPRYPDGYIPTSSIWENCIEKITKNYIQIMSPLLDTQRIFAAISIIGCKDIPTICGNDTYLANGKIDRNLLLCTPTVFIDIKDKNGVMLTMKRLQLEYLLSMGIKNAGKIDELLQAIYSNDL